LGIFIVIKISCCIVSNLNLVINTIFLVSYHFTNFFVGSWLFTTQQYWSCQKPQEIIMFMIAPAKNNYFVTLIAQRMSWICFTFPSYETRTWSPFPCTKWKCPDANLTFMVFTWFFMWLGVLASLIMCLVALKLKYRMGWVEVNGLHSSFMSCVPLLPMHYPSFVTIMWIPFQVHH
jgi:hypothetical protein